MSSFDKFVEQQQIQWRTNHIVEKEYGTQNGIKREWLLPHHLWEQGLWAGIGRESDISLIKYLEQNGVTKHDGVHNLKSSWMLCANLYFACKQEPQLLADFLREYVSPQIKSVEQIELEYSEKPPRDPQTLLGEPASGTRGKNQTSPDIAFIVTTTQGGRGLILTENKFTEHSFYKCSGQHAEYGNPDLQRCLDIHAVVSDVEANCHQCNWANEHRPNRLYWKHLKLSGPGKQRLTCCPAYDSGCQLFRQQALAEALSQNGPYEFVYSCVAYDERNTVLIHSMSHNGIEDFRTDWAGLFEGQAKFASFSHQQWVNWVRGHNPRGNWNDWLNYVHGRYGL